MGVGAIKGCVQLEPNSVMRTSWGGGPQPLEIIAMKTLARAGVLAALLSATAAFAPAAMAQAAPPLADPAFEATTLDLSAFGETRIAPDEATITLGVQTTAPSAAQAMADNAARMAQVTAALRRAGVADKDVQTSNISLGAQYEYPPNQPPRLTGYQASNEVVVTVEELARLGPALDAVTQAGANQVGGISFGLKTPLAAEDAARRAAVAALRAKAELYAQATGYHVTRLVRLSEGGGYTPEPPRPLLRMAAMAEAGPTPVSPGELSVRVDVAGVYELGR
jgi:uncharacterized protein YggE